MAVLLTMHQCSKAEKEVGMSHNTFGDIGPGLGSDYPYARNPYGLYPDPLDVRLDEEFDPITHELTDDATEIFGRREERYGAELGGLATRVDSAMMDDEDVDGGQGNRSWLDDDDSED